MSTLRRPATVRNTIAADRPDDWRNLAACRGTDPGLFHAEGSWDRPANAYQLAAARAVCETCPVKARCLAAALTEAGEFDEWAGIRGGHTPGERRTIRRRQQRKEKTA